MGAGWLVMWLLPCQCCGDGLCWGGCGFVVGGQHRWVVVITGKGGGWLIVMDGGGRKRRVVEC